VLVVRQSAAGYYNIEEAIETMPEAPELRAYPKDPQFAIMLPRTRMSLGRRSRMAANQYRISDELWAKTQPLLPKHVNTHRFGGGRPRADDRKCMDAIFFVLRTGCQWNALNATGICPSSTAHDRFQEWVKAGVFQKLWAAGLHEYDELKGLDWSWQSMDGAMTKAPLGGEKNRP
jgi:transposase